MTHDSNLLDWRIVGRDQVWFVRKSQAGASSLYSLAEFDARARGNFEHDYLLGRYGAIPDTDHLQMQFVANHGSEDSGAAEPSTPESN